MQTNPNWTCSDEVPTLPEVLKLLSFNIQVGINTQRYHHYLTRGWQHLLPHARRQQTLAQIAQLISEFDVVALQEVDRGGLRSGVINHVEHLAGESQFPYYDKQPNGNPGRFAQPANGSLIRYQPLLAGDHKRPGMLTGRGASRTSFCQGPDSLRVVMMHL